MASVGKYDKRSPYWYAAFTDATGRRLKKSTGQTSKSKAREIANTWQKASNEARQLRLTEARAREVISELMQSVGGETLTVFTVRQWFEHFVSGKKKSRAAKTSARHDQIMRKFIEFLGKRADLNIAAVTSRDIAAFRDRRQSLGLAPATLNLDIIILSAAFNSALRQGHVSVNPCLAIEPLKDKNPQRKGVFTSEQVAALVKAAEGDWRSTILTAFYTGARMSDVANLRWSNVDLVSEIKTIRFHPRKGGGEVVTVIHPALEDYLLSMPTAKSDDQFLFSSLAERNASTLSNWFRKIMEKAHIEHREVRKRVSKEGRSVSALSFHSLRHSFTSALANAGIREELRMALTGHTTRDIHAGYTHHELAALQDAVAVLSKIPFKQD
jgi:integrase